MNDLKIASIWEPDEIQSHWYTRAQHAIREGNINELIRVLDEAPPNSNSSMLPRSIANPFIIEASMAGRRDIVEFLLNRDPSCIEETDANLGGSSLHHASRMDCTGLVETLIRRKPEHLLATDASGYYPLHYAAEHGNRCILETLVQAGAPVNSIASSTHVTPLMLAAWKNHPHCVEYLLEQDNNIDYLNCADNERSWTALHGVAYNGNTDVALLLLSKQAHVDPLDNQKETPLFIASRRGHDALVKVLIDHSANIDAINAYGLTCLCISSFLAHRSVVQQLLHHGANVAFVQQETGRSPLHFACQGGDTEVVTMIIQRFNSMDDSVDVNRRDAQGKSALDLATEVGAFELLNNLFS